jgi:hypothetical protein
VHYLCGGQQLSWPRKDRKNVKESSILKSKIWLAAAVFVLCLFQPVLTADALQFIGSDVFPNDTPVTEYTAPGAAWSISFIADDHPDPLVVTGAGFDVLFSNFNYSLGGTAISVTPEIRFFSSDFGGMLDISFVSSAEVDMDPVTGLSFTGPAIFTGATALPVLEAGSYTATGGVFWVASSAVQTLSGTTVVVAGTLSDTAVPEPGTVFELAGAGLCFAAYAVMRGARRRRS